MGDPSSRDDPGTSGVRRASFVPSGAEIARALKALGFDVRVAGPDHATVMYRSSAAILIPMKERVHPGLVRTIIHTLGVTPKELVACLT